MVDYLKIANDWRREHPLESTSGYVLIFGEIPWTWQEELPDPSTVLPGNRAISVDGAIFIAVKGNNIDNATYWKKCKK